MDHQAGVRPTERRGKQDLLRAALHRGKLRPAWLLHGRRVEERAFAEGRGPDPRTKDNVGGVQSVRDDPLQ